MGLSENVVYPYTQWLMIIIPTKWLFHWEYTPFSDIPILPMTDPWCCYINANIKGVSVDGIHGTPYIAAPWIRHGLGIS